MFFGAVSGNNFVSTHTASGKIKQNVLLLTKASGLTYDHKLIRRTTVQIDCSQKNFVKIFVQIPFVTQVSKLKYLIFVFSPLSMKVLHIILSQPQGIVSRFCFVILHLRSTNIILSEQGMEGRF